jgi:hypothetical protein
VALVPCVSATVVEVGVTLSVAGVK